jgi:large-conductance mechanosensitive channel
MRICCISYIINFIVQAFLFISVVKINKLKLYDKQKKNEQLLFDKAKKL